MYITRLCPNIKANFASINTAAQAVDVDLNKGISVEAYPDAAPKLLDAMAFVAMMNDAGGPFPCDWIIKMLATKNADQTWKEFLLVPDARND